jgi:hypothetical protein
LFIWPDGERDVIRCGNGDDYVEYFGAKEPLDKLVKCEDVPNPNQSDGKSDARAEMEQRAAR